MPENQNHLIAAVAAVQPNTVVVLHNGSAVEMPWLNDVPAVLELYLAGDGAGEAAVDLLYGAVNPSGKLAETFPRKLSDTPAYLSFPGERETSVYTEAYLSATATTTRRRRTFCSPSVTACPTRPLHIAISD